MKFDWLVCVVINIVCCIFCVLPWLHKMYSSRTRSRAVNIFTTCSELIFTMSDVFPVSEHHHDVLYIVTMVNTQHYLAIIKWPISVLQTRIKILGKLFDGVDNL